MSEDKRIMLDVTGRKIVDALYRVANAIDGSGTIYGFRIDAVESGVDAKVTYIEQSVGFDPAYYDFINDRFEWGSWRDAFFIPRPCMVKYDGTVDYYLDPNDYTKKADGSASDVANTSYAGNAMMEWGRDGKKIWLSIRPSSDRKSAEVRIADYKADNTFHCWSFINHEGKECDHFYTPIYNGSEITETLEDEDTITRLRSISGQLPCHIKNATTEITYATNNNPEGITGWYTEIWSDVILINMLLVLISKSTNGQMKFGYGYNQYDAEETVYRGIIASGSADKKGLFYGASDGTAIVKVFGMENWWGNIWRRFAGLICVNLVWKVKYTWGMEDGSAVEGYNTNGNGYIDIGNVPITNNAAAIEENVGNYTKNMVFDHSGSMLPLELGDGATSSTYYPDYIYVSPTLVAAYPLRGGRVSDSGCFGFFGLAVHYSASVAGWYIGAGPSLSQPA